MQVGNQKTLSVVATCYNGAQFLPTFFNCINNQTYQNLQLILVSDGSTDGSLGLIKDFCKSRENCIWIDSNNQGVASAKDKGLVMASGEWVTFCDVDDILHPMHFENLVTAIESSNADVAVCGFKRISAKKAVKFDPRKIKFKNQKVEIFDKDQAFSQYFSQEKFDFLLVNKIFRLSVVRRTGARFMEGTRYGEEAYFAYNFFKGAEKTALIKAQTYYYVQWKSSLMHTGFNPSRLDIYKNINAVMEDCQKEMPHLSHYVNSMRSGYSCGMLLFMKKSKFSDANLISEIIESLKLDCKKLKLCKKTAGYKRVFIPLVVPVAKMVFAKTLKKLKQN